jgi:hypothetical protein
VKRFLQYYVSWLLAAVPVVLLYAIIANSVDVPAWIPITFFGLIGVTGVPVALSGPSGERAMRRRAAQLGLHYEVSGTRADMQGFTRSPFVGSARSVSHVMRGTWRDRGARTFLYGAGGAGGGFHVCVVAMPGQLPTIELVPRGLRGHEAPSGSDIEMESMDFNARWRVMCTDLKYAHAVLHPRMIQRLLEPGADFAAITIEGASMFAAYPNSGKAKATIPTEFDLLCDLIDLVPPHVWREFGGLASRPMPQDPTALAFAEMVAAHEVVRPQGYAMVGDRAKNLQGRLAVLLSLTFFMAPLGIIMGHRGLRSVRLGTANNPKTARVGIVLGWVLTILFVLMIVAATLIDASG